MPKMYRFSLPDIQCITCVDPIYRKISLHKAELYIQDFYIDHEDKTLTIVMENVEHKAEDLFNLLVKQLDDIGVSCIKAVSVKQWLQRHWIWAVLGLGTGSFILVLCLMVNPLPTYWMLAMAIISIPLTIIIGAESFKIFFKMHALNMDTLFSISTLTVMVVSIAGFIFPALPMMFDVGLLIFGFRHLGLAIEASLKQIMGFKTTFRSGLPSRVRLETGEQVFLTDIKKKNRLLINPGEIIPVDGIFDVDAFITQLDFTGNMELCLFRSGQQLLAGMTYRGSQPICLTATACVENSSLAKLDREIAQALKEKAPLETATKKMLQYFIPLVMGLAFISAIMVGYFFSPVLGLQCAVAVLVSACPCTLGLITPLAIQIGMKKACKAGVFFKSAKKLQEAAGIDSVFFDLNGTLTHGKPVVREIGIISKEVTQEQLFTYALILEQNAPHMVAKVIYDYVREKPHDLSIKPQTVDLLSAQHNGVAARMDGVDYRIGNQDFMSLNGIVVSDVLDHLVDKRTLSPGDSLIYLARKDHLLGYFIIHDPLRKEAIDVVTFLKASGKQVYLCTGADEATSMRYAKALGISVDNVKFQRAPSRQVVQTNQLGDKQGDIKALQEQGCRVAMVGDAGNDAVAVAASDFGIAIQSGSMANDVTQDKAGIVISDQSLWSVVIAMVVAEQTVRNIKQNLLFSLIYNVGVMCVASGLLLTLGVVINPSIGVALMILQSSLILLNAYFFKQQPLPKSQAQEQILESSYSRVIETLPYVPSDQSQLTEVCSRSSNFFVKRSAEHLEQVESHRIDGYYQRSGFGFKV